MCFANAQKLVVADVTATLKYAEGYAVGAAGFPVLHGWATINEKVVDLTWRLPKAASRPRLRHRVVGVFPEGWAYRGVGFDATEVCERTFRTGFYQSYIDDWRAEYPLLRRERRGPLVERAG